MTPSEIVAQIIGIFAMAFNILSYQQKKQRTVIVFQLFGTALFTVNFFMIEAYMGALLNFIGVIRALVFMHKEKLKADNVFWLIGFLVTYAVAYVLTFTVFGKPFTMDNAFLELLPIIGMTATTLAYRSKDAKTTRKLSLINSPSWLIYNIACFSIGAICCEVLSLVSIVVGMLRLDKKEKEATEEKTV